MGYCESTDEDGHLCLCVWSRLPLVVLYYSLPPRALLPASISSVPTNTASVPPLLVDANLPCFRANTSTTSCAACLRLRFPRSQSMPTHPHFYFMCGVPMPTASVCGFSQCVARVFTPLHCSAMNPLDATFVSSLWAGLHSISSQDSACSATHGLPPATATIMRVHMQPDAAVLLSSASRVVR